MRRNDKEINKAIKDLENKREGSMGAYRASKKIEALQECLELDEEEIQNKADALADSDYELYAVYDWAIEGRDNF